MNPSTRKQSASGVAKQRSAAALFLIMFVQLAMAGLVVYLYEIEGRDFFNLFALAVAGFVVNRFLPNHWRLPFFVLLSFVGIFLVFEPADGAWLIGSGLLLIGLCHLPIPLWARVAFLIMVGGLFAASRVGQIETPWSAVVWPVLGSMFMFRLVIYLRAMQTEAVPGRFWAALGYFFMFPNLAFPLFPVIDYLTFRRTYFDKAEAVIYEQALLWIARGLVHLVLYRLVYYHVVTEPQDVATLGDLLQFMLGTFLLYLRVSGTFHIAVGILHLFGFRLPETHKLYYLSSSFTELWRRINIYWKDFMMSFVFYPVYFQVKRLGPVAAVVVSTAAVFAATWLLHSYQWFWLRGGFPVTAQDILFWGLLGVLVVVGAVRELRRKQAAARKSASWSVATGLRTFLTFAVFCFLWSLWSAESVGQWIWTLGAVTEVDPKGVLLLVALFAVLVLLGSRKWDSPSLQATGWRRTFWSPTARSVTSLTVLLFLALPTMRDAAPPAVAGMLRSLQMTGLNAGDAAMHHRGYYEELHVRPQLAALAADDPAIERADWKDLSSTGVLRIRDDFLERDLLPSRSVIWNGLAFSTNRWGMRDQDYSQEKPEGTLRIALLGPSHVMGNGVSDGSTFEAIVEDRLNREFTLDGYDRFEILNFAVDGYCGAQQLALLEDRVFEFSPDVVITTGYKANAVMTRAFLQKIVSRGIEVPFAPVANSLAEAGLAELPQGNVPVPFESWRNIAAWIGIEARMPHAEMQGRIRRVSDEISSWSVKEIAEISRQHGAVPVVLALDAVLDVPSRNLPNESTIRAEELPVLDLLDIYPEEQRESLRVAPWDDHPNLAGHQLIADNLYPALTGFLSREFDRK